MVQITLTIPDAKWTKFYGFFSKAHPKPEGSALTDEQWVEHCTKEYLLHTCQNVAQEQALKTAEEEFDKDIIT